MTTIDARRIEPVRTPTIAGAIALYVAGGLFWAFLPFFVSLQMQRGELSAAAAGLLGTAYLLGFTLSSMLAVWWAPRIALRSATFGAAGVIALGFWSLGSLSGLVPGLLACMVIGMTMGSLWVIAYRILALAPRPDRAFAVAIGVSYPLLALITFVASRWVVPRGGLSGVLLTIVVLVGVLSLGCLRLPGRFPRVEMSEGPGAGARGASPAGWLSLAALFFTGFAFACIWSFAARIGSGNGVSPDRVGLVLSSNLLLTGVGSLAASVLLSRTKRLGLLLMLTVMGTCIVLLIEGASAATFTLALAGLGFGIGTVMPFQLADVARSDVAGALTGLIPAIQGAGSALGPPVAGYLWDLGGISFLAGGALIAVLASVLCSSLVGWLTCSLAIER